MKGDPFGPRCEEASGRQTKAQPGSQHEHSILRADEDDGAYVFRHSALLLDTEGKFGSGRNFDHRLEVDLCKAVGVHFDDACIDRFGIVGIDDPELVVFGHIHGRHFFQFEDAILLFAVPDDDGDTLAVLLDSGLKREVRSWAARSVMRVRRWRERMRSMALFRKIITAQVKALLRSAS